MPLNIALLISPAQHPVSGLPVASACDIAAFELGCQLTSEPHLTILCAGPIDNDSLNEYFGLGAKTIEVIAVNNNANVVSALKNRLQGFDLVLCGVRSDGQQASGLLPYYLAEALRMPLVNEVLEAGLEERTLQIRQFLPRGRRRRLEVSLPAVLTVHKRAKTQQPPRQYAWARARAGRIIYSVTSLPLQTTPTLTWTTEPTSRRPRPLKAQTGQSGHSRMMSAINENPTKTVQVVKEGNANQKAADVLAYLREHSLIDF